MNNDRKKTLNAVRHILAATASPFPVISSSPRTTKAVFWAAPFALLGMMFSYASIGAVAALVVFAVVWKRSPPETWSERFFKLLADYQPLDEPAYQALLGKIKANTAKRDDVHAWLNVESAHVERPGELAAKRSLLDQRLDVHNH